MLCIKTMYLKITHCLSIDSINKKQRLVTGTNERRNQVPVPGIRYQLSTKFVYSSRLVKLLLHFFVSNNTLYAEYALSFSGFNCCITHECVVLHRTIFKEQQVHVLIVATNLVTGANERRKAGTCTRHSVPSICIFHIYSTRFERSERHTRWP